jgi:hypothetical protein
MVDLPLQYIIADDFAWVAVVVLFFFYFRRSGIKSGQWNYKCPICEKDVRKIKANNGRYIRFIAHDKFTWRNPLAFYQTNRFCGFEHLNLWILQKGKMLDQINKATLTPQPISDI